MNLSHRALLLLVVTTAQAVVGTVRFATYNASLNRNNQGDLVRDLSTSSNAQAAVIAEIIQRIRPDVLLINEFDYDPAAPGLFQTNYLSVPRNGAAAIVYPYRYVAPSNTGVPSGFDLDNSGSVGGPNDALGFGFFPGQFGLVVYSMFPIVTADVRTFQNFLWKDMPNNRIPPGFYDANEIAILPLSSKSHWDVPIQIGADLVHFLVSHPTPPVFDGPEDRNGRRNYDEIRLWADYIAGASYMYDDKGVSGGLPAGSRFVIAGDQNSDPLDGDSIPGSAQLLLNSPFVNADMTPTSLGAVEQNGLQGGANAAHRGDPKFDTADFADNPSPGNLRADYVLPSRNIRIVNSAVFWPLASDPLFRLIGVFPFPSSDHKPVYIDIPEPNCAVSYRLYNAETDALFAAIVPGGTVIARPPCQINVEAVVACPTPLTSVVTIQLRAASGGTLRGRVVDARGERTAPYFLYGDSDGDVFPGTIGAGNYTLNAIVRDVTTPSVSFRLGACTAA